MFSQVSGCVFRELRYWELRYWKFDVSVHLKKSRFLVEPPPGACKTEIRLDPMISNSLARLLLANLGTVGVLVTSHTVPELPSEPYATFSMTVNPSACLAVAP